MNRALFIFRRDLRLEDNTGLIFALKNAKEVVVCFIFTPEQINDNPYRSDHCLQFMIESLEELEESVSSKGGKLYLFWGKPEKIVAQCIEELAVDGVIVNCDYTPYSIARDKKIELVCKKHGAVFHSFEDATLFPLEETLKSDGKPYTVFTPFFRNASRLEVLEPRRNSYQRYYSRPISFAKTDALYKKILPKRVDQQKGGRSAALKILKDLPSFSNYATLRDFPSEDGTTHLSAHMKFTTCSPREVYHAIAKKLGPESELIRSLFWRDFFFSIAYHFPRVFKGAFKTKFNQLPWNSSKRLFRLWCEGKTGFPIVDAGMREMNQTGYMHNRVRMIAASFLIKDLGIDWRWGEKYFAQTLIDYDPSVNNGNWQWVASTGCDGQPYFRIFNPWTQGLKFDPECLYIKQWIPELEEMSPKEIHHWHLEKNHLQSEAYPPPCVDHSKEVKLTLQKYQRSAST